jgi:hypothetical protein
MKSVARVVGLLIIVLGLVGIVAPDFLVAMGMRAVNPPGLYVIGALRIAIGLVLLGAASASRMPRTLRVFGVVAIVAGMATPLFGVDQVHAYMNWILSEAPMFARLAGAVTVGIGSFIAYSVSDRRLNPYP